MSAWHIFASFIQTAQSLTRQSISHLEPVEICRLEIIRGTATPVHNVLILAFAAQFTVPVGDAQIVVHHGATMRAVFQHSVKETLQNNSLSNLDPPNCL